MVAMLRSSSYFSSCSPAVCALWIPLVFYLGFSCSNRFRKSSKWPAKNQPPGICVGGFTPASFLHLQLKIMNSKFSTFSIQLPGETAISAAVSVVGKNISFSLHPETGIFRSASFCWDK